MTPWDRVESEVTADLAPAGTRAPLVPDRALVLLVLALGVVLLIAVTVSLVFWHTTAAQPIELPMVRRA